MDNHGDNMEIGQTDIYTITDSTDIGEFKCVSIRTDGVDGWNFAEVSASSGAYLSAFNAT